MNPSAPVEAVPLANVATQTVLGISLESSQVVSGCVEDLFA